jgi:hypothetical protein
MFVDFVCLWDDPAVCVYFLCLCLSCVYCCDGFPVFVTYCLVETLPVKLDDIYFGLYIYLKFAFISSEIGTQTENKNVFKINMNCGIF